MESSDDEKRHGWQRKFGALDPSMASSRPGSNRSILKVSLSRSGFTFGFFDLGHLDSFLFHFVVDFPTAAAGHSSTLSTGGN